MPSYNEIDGDLFDNLVDNCAILHIVNCKNVFGAGFAKVLAKEYPLVKGCYHMFFDANADIEANEMLGYVQICSADSDRNIFVGNMFCQEDYGRNKNIVYVDYDAIKTALDFFASNIKDINQLDGIEPINTVIMPKIGSGLANGNWGIISNMIREILVDKHEMSVIVYCK